MRIHLSGKQFIFPRSCACCGAYPLTSLPASGAEWNRGKYARTLGWSWDIPYCVACKKHIITFERLSLAGLILIALVGVTVALATLFGRVPAGLVFGGSMLAGVMFVYGALVLALRRSCSANCTGLIRSVTYLGSEGSRHSFEVKSRFYASDFVRANPRKLVNLSPEVVSALRGVKYGEHQIPKRFIKRGR